MKMESISYNSIKVTGGFWKDRRDLNRNVTVPQVFKVFDETGRIKAFKCDAEISKDAPPHFFWDSDVAKWIEAVAYVTADEKAPELERLVDEIADDIEKNQGEDGYFNIFFTVVQPENRFKNRDWHELYCAGHLMEAAVEYYLATGKRKLLDCMEKYGDYIEKVFVQEDSAAFVTPGHQEIELALIKMYECTKNEKWKRLAEFFIDNRGLDRKEENSKNNPAYNQSHIPVRDQREAVGHSVRACYLYAAMADIAYLNGDERMKEACDAIFDNIINKRMYITGGVGSTYKGEAFTQDYDLPASTAYAETCAAIALAFFARRMQKMSPDSIYADIIERVYYNGFLASTSLDGKCFFYENPLEIEPRTSKLPGERYPITERVEYFQCSCCPPNITRFVASITDGMYTLDNAAGDIYIRQFMESEAEFDTPQGKCRIKQITDYPRDGKVRVEYKGSARTLWIRVPSWCDSYSGRTVNGNIRFDVKDGDVIELDFEMKPLFIEADVRVNDALGKAALTYGPLVMCLESVDNGPYLRDIRVKVNSPFTVEKCNKCGAVSLTLEGTRRKESSKLYGPMGERVPVKVKFIPYFAFGNRGDAEMTVYFNTDL